MLLINATNETALNPFNHSDGLLVFYRDAVVDLAPSERSRKFVYQLLAHKSTVTLRALGGDCFRLNGETVSAVSITGGPVMVMSVNNEFEVITPNAEVSAVGVETASAPVAEVEAEVPLTSEVDETEQSAQKPKAKRRRRLVRK